MKITPSPQHSRNSKQKKTKLTKVSVFRTSLIRVNSCDSRAVSSFSGAPSGRPLPTLVFIWLSLLCTASFAQTPDSVAEREVQRRQTVIPQGEAALARGQAAMKAKNYTAAHEEFRTAVLYLPDAVVSGKAHDEAVEGFCKSGVILAEARIAEGRYADAEAILSEILSDRYDSKCHAAQELYAHLRQPGYFNKTMSPSFIEKVERVKQLLAEADGFYNSGRYDLASKRYEQVLNLDPYNTAARRGQEKINNTKYKYGEEAYNETRSRQLWQVEKAWEEPVRKYGQAGEPVVQGGQRDSSGLGQITNKLNTIIIPHIEFRDASIREAIDFLQEKAAENDPATEGEKGVNIVLRSRRLGEIAPPPAPVPVAPAAAPGGAAAPAATAAPGVGSAGGTTPVTTAPGVAPVVIAAPENARISIKLNQIPLGEALRYISNLAGLKVKVEPHAVLLIPISEESNRLITKRYHIPPEFFGGPVDVGMYLSERISASAPIAAGGGTQTQPQVAERVIDKNKFGYISTSGLGGSTSAEATQTVRQQLYNDRQLVERATAEQFLHGMGVGFPEIDVPEGGKDRASATFVAYSNMLVVRNTQDNLDLVDALVEEAWKNRPQQVEIESKFVEITQNNLKELGFDWLLGPFNIGNHKVFGSGGTAGTGTATSAANFPFIGTNGAPVGSNTGIPGDGTSGGPITAGNRSGTAAISANAIDALLFPGATGMAPGIFGLAGVFTDPQFQVVIHALNQKKGVDLLSAPRVTTKSGQRAIIEIVREFRYPTTFTAPQVPSLSSSTVTGPTTVPVVVTPTTPQTFETRNTGVTLEVEPIVGSDRQTVDLNLVPQVVEFEGFINYGSPINAVGVNTVGGANGISVSTPVLLTSNVINQPIFSTRKVNTSVSIYDGQTVVLGGLMSENVQKTEDRTPIVGDIPLIGRLFRTNVDQHIKTNLVIFVTAHLVTPGGQPLNATEEEEEGGLLQPPALPEVPAYKK